MRATLAGTSLPPSAVHAMIEIGNQGATSATRLCELLMLDKSSTSRMLHKLVAAGEVAARVDERDGRARTLSLTAKGRQTLAEIDRFAQRQVAGALDRMASVERQLARRGLAAYAGALQASRTGLPDPGKPPITIRTGYFSGVIGRTVEMHARFYAAAAGFGPVFESKVAAGLAEFVQRLDRPQNQLWSAVRDEAILGTIAIDGEDSGAGRGPPALVHRRGGSARQRHRPPSARGGDAILRPARLPRDPALDLPRSRRRPPPLRVQRLRSHPRGGRPAVGPGGHRAAVRALRPALSTGPSSWRVRVCGPAIAEVGILVDVGLIQVDEKVLVTLGRGQHALQLLDERLPPHRVGPAEQLLGLLPAQIETVQSRPDRLAAARSGRTAHAPRRPGA